MCHCEELNVKKHCKAILFTVYIILTFCFYAFMVLTCYKLLAVCMYTSVLFFNIKVCGISKCVTQDLPTLGLGRYIRKVNRTVITTPVVMPVQLSTV
jgi:hypothetical protein